MNGRYNEKMVPGAVFGRLTVICRLPRTEDAKGRRSYKVLCKCTCGNEKAIEINGVSSGAVVSCGCRKRECAAEYRKAQVKPGVGYGKVFPGAQIGRLLIIRRIVKHGKETGKALCKCDCGQTCKVNMDGLAGNTRSCGCLSREAVRLRNKQNAKFGGFSSKYPNTHSSWSSMMGRCYAPQVKSYSAYGAKGVVVCKRLRKSPWGLKNTIGVRKNKKLSLDRFPIHNGNYTCGRCKECKKKKWKLNVRWATRKEQALNMGNHNVYLEAFGKRLTKSQWGELTGLSWITITNRQRRGLSHEQILATPDARGNCYRPSVAIA